MSSIYIYDFRISKKFLDFLAYSGWVLWTFLKKKKEEKIFQGLGVLSALADTYRLEVEYFLQKKIWYFRQISSIWPMDPPGVIYGQFLSFFSSYLILNMYPHNSILTIYEIGVGQAFKNILAALQG